MKSGFVAVVGKTNTGKSTFLNKLLKTKISIVSPKKQTTRTNINGIYNETDYQIVFIDTPGIHKPSTGLGKLMNKMAIRSSKDVEVILHFVDIGQKFDDSDVKLLKSFSDRDSHVILALTKIDKYSHQQIIESITKWKENYNYEEIVPISSIKNKNIDELLLILKSKLVNGPQYYGKEVITNVSKEFKIAELIREKALYLLRDEVPHSLGINILKLSDEEKFIEVFADLIVEKTSQKGIVIGKQASMIKKITTQSKKDIKYFLNKKVNLELNVRVEKDWRKKEQYFNLAGVKIDL